MVLAALAGALIIELVPQNALMAHVTLIGIVVVALIGTFLPVPMAVDVAIAYLAMTRGVPLPYVVTLLCTLGIYSVYSFAMVGKTISWKVAAAVYGAVAFRALSPALRCDCSVERETSPAFFWCRSSVVGKLTLPEEER